MGFWGPMVVKGVSCNEQFKKRDQSKTLQWAERNQYTIAGLSSDDLLSGNEQDLRRNPGNFSLRCQTTDNHFHTEPFPY